MSDPVTRQEQLLSAIATGGDIISPITRGEMYLAYLAGDTSVVLPEPITRKEQFLYQACLNGGGGGGTEIADGIVVKARDTDGYATDVDFYGTVVGNHQFGDEDGAHCWSRLETVNFKKAVTEIGNCAFLNTNSSNIDIPKTVTKIGVGAFGSSKIVHVVIPYGCTFVNSAFGNCKQMITYLDERPAKNSYYTNSGQFVNNTALATVTLGSVGYPVIGMRNNMFAGCTQTGLTITIYTTGANADGYLSAIRNGATNATIILKASEDTTYNGTSYAAGETMITSTVEAAT